jgi:methionine-rich copper-binding protein CopC
MKGSRTLVAAIVALIAATSRADAHAHYRSSIPADGAVIERAPDVLRIDFSEGVEPAFSHVQVVDADGHAVPTGALSTAPGDSSVVIVPLHTAMRAGRYVVTWEVTAVDTHRTHGSYSFTVGR